MYSKAIYEHGEAKIQWPKASHARLETKPLPPLPDIAIFISIDTEEKQAKVIEAKDSQVFFDANDPEDPQNFNPYHKAWITAQLGALSLTGSLGTSIIAPAESDISKQFNVDLEMTVLTVALFVLGFALGPVFWAPISEVYGRRWSMLPAVFILGLFSIGSARSQTLSSLLITRFFGGVFGSAPNGNATAALGDIYGPRMRGIAMTVLALCQIGGPTLAPILGSAVTANPHLGWRCTEYTEAVIVFTVLVVSTLSLPETYCPVILKHKAIRLRKQSGKKYYWHPHENEKMKLSNIVTKYLSRPLRMIVTEPMVACLSLYAAFVYGLLFLTLEVFPIVYGEDRGWSLFKSTLPLLALFVGGVAATSINLANQPLYIRAVKENNGHPVPEARLPPMFIGSCLFSAGIFMFGWTAAPRYPWPLSVVAAGFMGAGFNIVYQQGLNFLVDAYGPYGASAVSATTILRSFLACALPLAARPMFRDMGVGPASSLLGGISCLAIPIPFILTKYGLKLRRMSHFAQALEDQNR